MHGTMNLKKIKNLRCMTSSEEPLETPRKEPELRGTQFENLGRDELFAFLILSCVAVRTVTGTAPPCCLLAFRRFRKIAKSYC